MISILLKETTHFVRKLPPGINRLCNNLVTTQGDSNVSSSVFFLSDKGAVPPREATDFLLSNAGMLGLICGVCMFFLCFTPPSSPETCRSADCVNTLHRLDLECMVSLLGCGFYPPETAEIESSSSSQPQCLISSETTES